MIFLIEPVKRRVSTLKADASGSENQFEMLFRKEIKMAFLPLCSLNESVQKRIIIFDRFSV